jgi:flagella basal body P-ring formation protein FlgA
MMSPNYLFLFFSVASAQSLLDISSLRPDLSLFFSYVNASPSLKLQFAAADNFTLLAPTNEAVLSFLDTSPSPSLIDATASYHLLQGAHSSASVNASGTVFVSNLNDTAFVNITQGQSVKAFNNGTFFVESWLKAKTNVVSAVSSPPPYH